jgi:16S rRNA (guanine527-N7)-methyltransferase
MRPARIAELLAPFLGESDQRLTTDDLHRISMYIDLLIRWNARINLTAIRNPEEIVTRHFGESLFAARHLFAGRASVPAAVTGFAVADLGSGAGFPGIPIKLWAPHIALTLIESNHKKSTFLREVTRHLILTDINIQTARAETLAAKTFHVVTLRAVERFQSTLPVAARLVAPTGRLALLIGSTQLDQAKATLQHLDSPWSNAHWSIELIPLSTSRVLAIVRRS